MSHSVPDNIIKLLNKYNETIKASMTGFDLNIGQVAMVVNRSPFSETPEQLPH